MQSTYVLNDPTQGLDPGGLAWVGPNTVTGPEYGGGNGSGKSKVLQPPNCLLDPTTNCGTGAPAHCFPIVGCVAGGGIIKEPGKGGLDDVDAGMDRLEAAAARGDVGAQRTLRAVSYFGKGNVAGFELPITRSINPRRADIVLKDGSVAEVGGYSKSFNVSEFGKQMSALSNYAKSQGVQAYFLYDAGTPQTVLDIAVRWVGPGNVIALP